jgi:IS30 family transposase
MKHYTQLSEGQRYQNSALLKAGHNKSFIAKTLQVARSTISRELKRNCDARSELYKHELAQKKCLHRHSIKPKAIVFTPALQLAIETQLRQDFSPAQIVGLAKVNNQKMVSHERIYQHIWAEKKKGGTLYKHLRNEGKRYRKRGALKDKRGIIPNRKDITERPKEVEEKVKFGHFEIDTVIGLNHKGALLTINERITQRVFIRLLTAKEAQQVKENAIEALEPIKKYIKTITADNGKEFAQHEAISKELDIDFYFAKPYCSWQRGANENMNRLIRQYLPKKTNFETLTKEQVQEIEDKLNNRPRAKLNFKTPNFVFNQHLN